MPRAVSGKEPEAIGHRRQHEGRRLVEAGICAGGDGGAQGRKQSEAGTQKTW